MSANALNATEPESPAVVSNRRNFLRRKARHFNLRIPLQSPHRGCDLLQESQQQFEYRVMAVH